MSDETSKIFDRIRALIAKAEATEYDGERESFEAKAAELMAEHAVSRDQLGAVGEADPLEMWTWRNGEAFHAAQSKTSQHLDLSSIMPKSYKPQAFLMLMQVARKCFGLYCFYIGSAREGGITMTGRRSQLEAFSATAGMFVIQINTLLAKPVPEQSFEESIFSPAKSQAAWAKSYRRGIVAGFYEGVIERFEINVKEHDEQHETSTLPALRSDVAAGKDWADVRTSNRRSRGTSSGSRSGRETGRSAGYASGGTSSSVGGGRRSLGA